MTKLSICSAGKIKLDNFQQFCGQTKEAIQMLKMIKSEQAKEEKRVNKHESICSEKGKKKWHQG